MAETNGQVAITQRAPEAPAWLSKAEREEFDALVQLALGANTPILEVDAGTYALIAKGLVSARKVKDPNALARIMRTLLPWMQAAGLTAIGRARLGVKQSEKKTSTTAKLLEMARKA
jgi:hypothetical protein